MVTVLYLPNLKVSSRNPMFFQHLTSKNTGFMVYTLWETGQKQGALPMDQKPESTPKNKKSAVEILVFKPVGPDSDIPPVPPDQRGVHENLWIKERFKKQYVSIGVYLDGPDLTYYFFEDCDNPKRKTYDSLDKLKQDLPSRGLENIFESTPKLFIMGHGNGWVYGLCNEHGPSEEICGDNFDKIIADFETALPVRPSEIFVTLEACGTDDRAEAAKHDQKKTFLERLSAKHRHITCCGTAPWDPKDVDTGDRAPGGFPTLNAPITAAAGGMWKNGNSVIFHHAFNGKNYQVAVRKSLFASTETAKELKINTLKYAQASGAGEKEIRAIALNRDILKISDLKKVPGVSHAKLEAQEQQILEQEKINYIARVLTILSRAESERKFTDRDALIIALGLKDPSVFVFEGHENLRWLEKILANKSLLQLVMVACGKVLIGGPSNDRIIDFLLDKKIDINSVDDKGMTALHYAVQNFYNYSDEPLKLIRKLLDCGANLNAKDKQGRTPLTIAAERCEKKQGHLLEHPHQKVRGGDNLLALLQQRQARAVPIEPNTRFRSKL